MLSSSRSVASSSARRRRTRPTSICAAAMRRASSKRTVALVSSGKGAFPAMARVRAAISAARAGSRAAGRLKPAARLADHPWATRAAIGGASAARAGWPPGVSAIHEPFSMGYRVALYLPTAYPTALDVSPPRTSDPLQTWDVQGNQLSGCRMASIPPVVKIVLLRSYPPSRVAERFLFLCDPNVTADHRPLR